jgi:hypothetical protein
MVQMAEDFLPIQPASRPEASAGKTASRPDDADGVTFGELLDAQANDQTQEAKPKDGASGEAKTDSADDAVSTDVVIPAATQAAPAPAPAAPTQNAVAAMMAALQSYSTQPGETADAVAEPIKTDGAPTAPAANANPAIPPQPTAPATTAATDTATTAAATATSAATTTAAAVTAAPKTAKTADPTTSETDATDTTADTNKTDATKTASTTATPATTETTTPTTQTTTTATTTTIAIETTTPATTKTATTKATEPTKESASSPGAERAADDGDGAAANTSANAAGAKASGQTVSPASAQANGGQANGAQTNAQAGADAAADVKVDVATTSTATSTSSADTLMKGAQTAEAPKHPALANAPQAVAQVYTRMIERMDGRAQRFEIRLDPEELGRVDVRIEIGADKKVHAVLAAHDSAAMSDLMRGQKALERALSDAGIDLADGGLQFEMSKDTGRGLTSNDQRGEGWNNNESANVWRGFNTVDVGVDVSAADLAAATRSYRRAASRLDLVA